MTFYSQGLSWHEGEKQMHKLTRVPVNDNPTVPFLAPLYAAQLSRFPLMAVGTLDADGNPWTTLWGGEPGFGQAVSQNIIGIRTTVDASFDPVVEAIYHGNSNSEVMKEEGKGRLISALSIDLETRNRNKLAGRIVAGALNATPSDAGTSYESGFGKSHVGQPGQIQLVMKIEQSLGNCPKYLNKKHVTPSVPAPVLSSTSTALSDSALDVISQADLFFISSTNSKFDMDTNHRGGSPGFIRTTHNPSTNSTSIVWPEYSGNNLYQTLGNLLTTPLAGLCIPNFTTGDVLYVTGTTEVLIGSDAHNTITASNLAVKLNITSSRLVLSGLPFRGTLTSPTSSSSDPSPYNPRIRYLTTENPSTSSQSASTTATLTQKTRITPTISRYRFTLSDPTAFPPWKPGQWVALNFSEEMYMGYTHMNDHDPRSLNDDFIRTFTVSSIYGKEGLGKGEFEVTVRKVGSVTRWLGWQREGTVVGVRGFGGEWRFEGLSTIVDGTGHGDGVRDEDRRTRVVGFVSQGIGITPLLGQMVSKGELDLERLKAFWSVGVKDVGLVKDVVGEYPDLKGVVQLFLTGNEEGLDEEQRKMLREVMDSGLVVQRRRIQKEDLSKVEEQVDDWYLCTAPAFKDVVQQWLPGENLIFEDFNY